MLLRAQAKLNLFLHITGRRADGYHTMESLVVFADLADRLDIQAADALSVVVEGEFAEAAGTSEANLVFKAARALQTLTGCTQGAALTLTKSIPVGAGLGGGSADAAAALRGLNAFWQLGVSEAALRDVARELGADVAMCLVSAPLFARGIGDVLTPLSAIPPLHAVLVHPRIALLTADVYRAFDGIEPMPAWDAQGDFWVQLRAARNHLQRPAIAVEPLVAQLLLELETLQPTPELVRMTGSGACCFALYATQEDAARAAALLTATHPQWWVRAVNI